jgi:hypothetical protein
LKETIDKTFQWIEGYKKQGYYKTGNCRQIPFEEIIYHCTFIAIPKRYHKYSKEDIYYHALLLDKLIKAGFIFGVNNIKSEKVIELINTQSDVLYLLSYEA